MEEEEEEPPFDMFAYEGPVAPANLWGAFHGAAPWPPFVRRAWSILSRMDPLKDDGSLSKDEWRYQAWYVF